MFCKHEWEILSETILPSPYEQMEERAVELKHVIAWFFVKKLIVIISCKKCGKLDKTEKTNP